MLGVIKSYLYTPSLFLPTTNTKDAIAHTNTYYSCLQHETFRLNLGMVYDWNQSFYYRKLGSIARVL
jgi:hypothetical protein